MKRLIAILAAALMLAGCGLTHRKVHPDDPWPEFSYEKVDSYREGKITKTEYACFIGIGRAPTQYFAEGQAEADAQARMAQALGRKKASLSGVTRIGETIVRFDQGTRMYTVYLRVGVPAETWRTYKKK